MAIQVTGLFQNPATGLIHQSPKLKLVPHLEYAGVINMDVHITGPSSATIPHSTENTSVVGTVPYSNIDRSTLTFNTEITDPYNQLIDGLETMVISNLQTANPINEQAIFEKVVLFVAEEPVVEEEAE
jgi:hypothetical protein